MSQNSRYIVVVRQGLIIALQDGEAYQSIKTNTVAFALSSSGDNLVYVRENNEGSLMGLCPFGYFYDGSQCQACQSSCSIC